MTFSAIDLRHEFEDTLLAFARVQGIDPKPTADNTGLWVSCHLDMDYQQFWLVEARWPYIHPEGPTTIDHLYVHLGPFGKWHVEWRNKPREMGTPLGDNEWPMDVHRDFIDWVEEMLEPVPE